MIVVKYKKCEDSRSAQHAAAVQLCEEILSVGFGIENPENRVIFREGKRPQTDIKNIDISIAHSKNLAAVGVMSGGKIGIDIECVNKKHDTEKLCKKYFSPAENKKMLNAENRTEAFFEIWTRKEAVCKLTGEGLKAIRKYDTENPPKSVLLKTETIAEDNKIYILSTAIEKEEID